jgi:hypothetical protein
MNTSRSSRLLVLLPLILLGARTGTSADFNQLGVAVNGACGAANGAMLAVAPTTNLCKAGSPSTVDGTGPWTWTCDGVSGGSSATCATADVGSPIVTGVPAGTWTWVDIEGSRCADGTETGFGIRFSPSSSKKVLILMAGSGGCNTTPPPGPPAEKPDKCCITDNNFSDYIAYTQDQFNEHDPANAKTGIFHHDDSNPVSNSVEDWNMVFIPLCTLDQHNGDKVEDGVTCQNIVHPIKAHHAGYSDFHLFLKRIVPTFPDATEVVLAGSSAGGYGALSNYLQTAKAFGAIPVHSLDDSGPFMEEPWLAPCLEHQWSDKYGLDDTMFLDCGTDCMTAQWGHRYLAYAEHCATAYPDRLFGLIESTHDGVIRHVLSNSCTGTGHTLSGPAFEKGLMDLSRKMDHATHESHNFGLYAFPSAKHTTLESQRYESDDLFPPSFAHVPTVAEWVGKLTKGQVSNVSP